MGGDTLARHVARSDGQLRERLRSEPGISAASTYLDRITAESIVGRVLMEQRTRIVGWQRAGKQSDLALDFRGERQIIGRSLGRDASTSVPCTDAVVVLRGSPEGHDPRTSGDYYVLTSYPEARR